MSEMSETEQAVTPDRLWLKRADHNGHQRWIESSGHDSGELEFVRAARHYFCSCGGALTAEEYITHYFELGHDHGETVQPIEDDPTVGKFLATIADGLRHAIRDHGSITKEQIGSAAKRVWSRIRGTRYDPFRSVSRAGEPHIEAGPLPTTAGGEQVFSRHYGDRIVYESRKVKVEIPDPPTSEAAKASGLRRIHRRHYYPETAADDSHCEGCSRDYLLAPDGLHYYYDGTDRQIWGVCRKAAAALRASVEGESE